MNGRMIDIAIVGGGLAGGLTALAVHRAHPDMRLMLLESGETLGGNHRWSWFDSDLSADGAELLSPLRRTEWNEGYDVRFPDYERRLRTPYRSMTSADFHEGLMRLLPEDAVRLNSDVAELAESGVTLADGTFIPARSVIDARGFAPTPHLSGGWQVFMGRRQHLAEPHGLDAPIIMDAAVDQHAPHGNAGAYRFVYTLPLGAHDLFIEDTYYADAPLLDRSALSSRIDAYARKHCWDGDPVEHETGVLPVVTGGDFSAYQAQVRVPGVAVIGARGGFTHPLTSYTLPLAAANALAIAADAQLPGSQLAAMIEQRARSHWRKTAFYRRLGRMLMDAARPRERYRIFERFYRLPEGLIERFYAARSPRADRIRILCGRPPVGIGRAIGALMGKSAPLTMERAA